MPTIDKNFIIFDHNDWLAGEHPQSGTGSPVIINGWDNSVAFNPFRNLGYATPGELAADVSNVSVVDAIMTSMEYVDSTSRAYGIAGTKIHEINASTGTITNAGSYPHTITPHGHSSLVGEDIIRYKISGVDYVFYSWNDNTDGDVGRLTASSDTFDDDYMSTTPGSAAVLDKDEEHPMIIGDDDVLYIGNGNELVAYDGPSDTLFIGATRKLLLPDDFKINSFAKLNNRTLVIYASTNKLTTTSSGQVKAYFWDYVRLDPYEVYDVWGSRAGGGFNAFGTVGVWTLGQSLDPGTNSRNLYLNLFNGAEFKTSANIKSTFLPSHGGVEAQKTIVYGNAGGTIYSYGSPFLGVKSGVQAIARGGGSTGGGCIKTLLTGRQFISSGTGISGGLEILNGNFDTGSIATSFAEPIIDIDQIAQVMSVRIDFLKAATGGRILDVSLFDREGNNIGQPFQSLTVTAKQINVKATNDIVDAPFGIFDALQLGLEWSDGDGGTAAPVVRRIIVEYNPINIRI